MVSVLLSPSKCHSTCDPNSSEEAKFAPGLCVQKERRRTDCDGEPYFFPTMTFGNS